MEETFGETREFEKLIISTISSNLIIYLLKNHNELINSEDLMSVKEKIKKLKKSNGAFIEISDKFMKFCNEKNAININKLIQSYHFSLYKTILNNLNDFQKVVGNNIQYEKILTFSIENLFSKIFTNPKLIFDIRNQMPNPYYPITNCFQKILLFEIKKALPLNMILDKYINMSTGEAAMTERINEIKNNFNEHLDKNNQILSKLLNVLDNDKKKDEYQMSQQNLEGIDMKRLDEMKGGTLKDLDGLNEVKNSKENEMTNYYSESFAE